MSIKNLGFCMSLCLLTACSGGGGGGGNTPSGINVSFTPSLLSTSLFEGDSKTLEFVGAATGSVSGDVYIVLSDASGTFQPDPVIEQLSATSYRVRVSTSATLIPAAHRGNIEVKLCKDQSCTSQHAGSPFSLPYAINVLSHTNLTVLSRLDSAADWTGFQGNSRHTGSISATFDSQKFSPRWLLPRLTTPVDFHDLVVANGLVHVASGGQIITLNENDGSVVWSQSPVFAGFDAPGLTGDHLYVPTESAIYSLQNNTGAQSELASIYRTNGNTFLAPVFDDANIFLPEYVNNGTGLKARKLSDGSEVWRTVPIQSYWDWTAAVDSDALYVYAGAAGLHVIDPLTGAISNTIPDTGFQFHSWSLNTAPVIAAPHKVLVVNGVRTTYGALGTHNQLIQFDTDTMQVKWAVDGIYTSTPSVSDDELFVANYQPKQLEVRDIDTGNLKWTWRPTSSDGAELYGNVVVAENLVFVSTDSKVLAIDRTTHQPIWSYPSGGDLAISANGVLYISRIDAGKLDANRFYRQNNGSLAAINLN